MIKSSLNQHCYRWKETLPMEEKENLSSQPDEIAEPTEPTEVTPPKKKKKSGKKKHKKIFTREKFRELWQDKRSFRTRLVTALLATTALIFTFFIFGPLEIYLSNITFFAFSFDQLIGPILLAGLGMIVVLTGVLLLLRGKIFTYSVSFLFSMALAGYLQGTFLNVNHGSLDGATIIWQNFKGQAALGLLLWAVIIIVPLALQYFSRKLWRRMVNILSSVVVGAQIVALLFLIFPILYSGGFNHISSSGFLTRDGMYTVSGKQNVIVFVLDRFDKDFADHQLFGDSSIGKEADPAIAEGLKGFTYYENFTGSYIRTYPSVAYLLTGVKTDYSLPVMDYLEKAWSEGTFLSDIKAAGYDSRVYAEINYIGGDINFLAEEADNLGYPSAGIPVGKLLSAMYGLSAYRYLPEFMKPYFHTYTGDISYNYLYSNDSGSLPYGLDDVRLRKDLLAQGLTVDNDSKGTFLYYHLQGSHDPFVMDGEGNAASFSNYFEGRFEQTRGNLKTILSYMDMLKEKGLYDDTTIIITADHGLTGTETELSKERLLALFIKPAGADTTQPLQRSNKQICQDNLRASISSYFGLTDQQGNRTIESIGEDEEMVRYFWMTGSNSLKTHREENLLTYKIVGDAKDFSNWELVETIPVKHPYYDAD